MWAQFPTANAVQKRDKPIMGKCCGLKTPLHKPGRSIFYWRPVPGKFTLAARRGKNISAVAVANKNARIAWAVLTRKEPYKAVAWMKVLNY